MPTTDSGCSAGKQKKIWGKQWKTKDGKTTWKKVGMMITSNGSGPAPTWVHKIRSTQRSCALFLFFFYVIYFHDCCLWVYSRLYFRWWYLYVCMYVLCAH
jgi:hypothetical protein